MCLLTYTASEELLVAFSYVCWFIVHSSSLPFGHYTFFRDVGNSYLRVLLSLWVRSFSNAPGDFDFFFILRERSETYAAFRNDNSQIVLEETLLHSDGSN